jgi:hypothetical protein
MQRGEQDSIRELPKRKVPGGHPQIFFDDASTAAIPRRQPQNNTQRRATSFDYHDLLAWTRCRQAGPANTRISAAGSHWPSTRLSKSISWAKSFSPGLIPNLTTTSIPNDRGPYGRAGGPGQTTQGMPRQASWEYMGPSGFPTLPYNRDGMMGMPTPYHIGGPQRSQFELYGDAGNLGPKGRGAPQGQYKR